MKKAEAVALQKKLEIKDDREGLFVFAITTVTTKENES